MGDHVGCGRGAPGPACSGGKAQKDAADSGNIAWKVPLGITGKQYVAITAAGASTLDDPVPTGAEALVVYAPP